MLVIETMTTAVSAMPVASDFGSGMRGPSPPSGTKHEGEGSPMPRKSRAVVTRNGGKTKHQRVI